MNPKTLLLILLFLFTLCAIGLYGQFVPDDTFIHIGYAKDIAAGKGYSFAGNATYGSTSPLWPLLLALFSFAHLGNPLTAQIVSLLFSLGTLVLLFKTARCRFDPVTALAAVALCVSNSYILRWSFTGMESTASCFFLLVLTYLLFREFDHMAKSGYYLLAGLSPLLRPEFYLFLLVFFLFLILTKKMSRIPTKVFLACLPPLFWNVFAYLYYGTIVPTTFSIKAGGALFSTEWETIVRSAKLIVSANPIELLVFTASAIMIGVAHFRRKRINSRNLFQSEYFLLFLWALLFYLYYLAKDVTVLSRYALVLLPVIILVTLHVLKVVCDKWDLSETRRRQAMASIVTVSLAVHIIFTVMVVKPDADSFTNGFLREYKTIAEELSRQERPGNAVAVSDVGVVGVYSGMKICDFVGLVDKDRFRFASNHDYFVSKRPQFLIHRNEFALSEIQDSTFSLQPIYSGSISSLGINRQVPVQVNVYHVFWR